jgi:hypothetical protein
MKKIAFITLFLFFAVSCGDNVSTKDSEENDDNSVWDNNSETKDDEVKDDADNVVVPDNDNNIQNDDDISDTCGNLTIESPEVCDGGAKDCVEIDSSKYSSGKAGCRKDCSGWDTATCTEITPDSCVNGERRCYGAYQYQTCSNGNWQTAVDCGDSATCYGEGRCTNECYPHDDYYCSEGHIYWYDTCGEREEIKENCGTSGHVGDKYCDGNYLYQDYETVGCSGIQCTSYTEGDYIKYCDNGCTNGECNVEPLSPPTNVNASDGSYSGYVYINWSAVNGATDYYIYRATSSTGTYSYVDESEGDDYYYDYPPLKNTTYYYKITAYNPTAGESEMSSYNAGWCY